MSGPRNISLIVEYDGTNYHGWQCQPNGLTVQEVMTRGVEKMLNHPVKLYAAGRTDAGVHAFGQVVNFFTEKQIEPANIAKGLNGIMPPDIRIKSAREVDETFHARYSAKSKSYVYSILNARLHSPFHLRYTWHIPYRIDSVLMNRALQEIVGVHDFSSFKKKDEAYRNHEREVLRARVIRKGAFIHIVIEATGFMRYMVRNIVGTIVLVGSGKINREDFIAIMDSRDRINAGPAAPPQGLFLRRIRY